MNIRKTEIPSQILARLPILGLLCAASLALACGGGAKNESGGEPLAPGDTRFLIARGSGIEEVTLSGQEKRLLELQDKSYVLQPSISPDGKRLAFIVELPARTGANGQLDFGADLYVSDRNGVNARAVLLHSRVGEYLESPDWVDDKTVLVGDRGLDPASARTFSRIVKIDLSTGRQEVLLEDAVMGAVSRDRKSLVYSSVDPQTRVEQLTVSDIHGGSPRIIVPDTSGLALFIATAFSPDGSQIAFAAVDVRQIAPPPAPPGAPPAHQTLTHPFAQDVWLVNRDGSGLKRLGEIAENMPSLTWSGDGSRIYVVGPSYLWRLDPVAATAEQVRQSGDRAWIVWLAGP
jgi:Tol biopolymer transport system component